MGLWPMMGYTLPRQDLKVKLPLWSRHGECQGWPRLAPNGTSLGFFKLSIRTFWHGELNSTKD